MRILAAIFLVFGVCVGAEARELVDATGVRVQVVDAPARIVTLAPSLGELVAEVLQMDLDRVVGVSE